MAADGSRRGIADGSAAARLGLWDLPLSSLLALSSSTVVTRMYEKNRGSVGSSGAFAEGAC